MFSACIWFSLVSTAWLFDEKPIRCLHPWGLWCCELCRVSFQSERLQLNSEKVINDESSQPLIFLMLKIQTLVATAALSSPLERALFPSASTDGGATLKTIVKNVIISSSSLPLAFHPLCNNSWLQDCGMAQVACWALGCSLGLADGQTWAKLVSDQLGLISPQVVHVLSAKQQFSELLHERSDLSGGPCHSFCNNYFLPRKVNAL